MRFFVLYTVLGKSMLGMAHKSRLDASISPEDDWIVFVTFRYCYLFLVFFPKYCLFATPIPAIMVMTSAVSGIFALFHRFLSWHPRH